MSNDTNPTRPDHSSRDLRSSPRVLKTFDGHGAYVESHGDHYFLCAAELNHFLDPGTSWDSPDARIPAVVRLVAEIEIESSAMTALGSFRFEDRDHYRKHRRTLSGIIRATRRVARWHETFLTITMH